MSQPSHIPAGFCPHCDYAMDPGICPECGREISEKTLAISARSQRIRRFARRGIKSLVVLAVLGGAGYGVYHETRPHRWVKYCTTDFLLSLDWAERDNVDGELEFRMYEKRLSREQTVAYLQGKTPSPWLRIQTPRPAGSAVRLFGMPMFACMGGCGGGGGGDLIWRHEISEELWVDGELRHKSNDTSWHSNALTEVIPRLSAGKHLVELRRDVRCEVAEFLRDPEFGDRFNLPHLPCIVQVSDSQEIEIEDAPYERFVDGRFDDEMREQAADGKWFEALGHNWEMHHLLYQSGVPPLAGRMTMTIRAENASPCQFTFLIPEDLCHLIHNIPECMKSGESISAIFEPNAKIAFKFGRKDYFNGIIEWNDVQISEGLPKFPPPDVVRPNDTLKSSTRLAAIEE